MVPTLFSLDARNAIYFFLLCQAVDKVQAKMGMRPRPVAAFSNNFMFGEVRDRSHLCVNDFSKSWYFAWHLRFSCSRRESRELPSIIRLANNIDDRQGVSVDKSHSVVFGADSNEKTVTVVETSIADDSVWQPWNEISLAKELNQNSNKFLTVDKQSLHSPKKPASSPAADTASAERWRSELFFKGDSPHRLSPDMLAAASPEDPGSA